MALCSLLYKVPTNVYGRHTQCCKLVFRLRAEYLNALSINPKTPAMQHRTRTTLNPTPLHHAAPTRRHVLASALGLLGAGSLTALTGCGGSAADEAQVRFVNATVDYAQADFYAGSDRLAVNQANGGAISSWYGIDAGDMQIALHAANSSTARLTETRTFDKNTFTSVIAYGSLANGLKFRYFAEATTSAASGQVKLRLCHASESLGGLDLYVSNATSLSGLSPTATVSAYGDLSTFATVSSGAYRIRVTAQGDITNVLFDYTAQINLSSTSVHTLVVVPRASGSYPNVSALQEQGDYALLANALVS